MYHFTQEKSSQSLMQVIEVRLRGGARASPSGVIFDKCWLYIV